MKHISLIIFSQLAITKEQQAIQLSSLAITEAWDNKMEQQAS